VDKDPDYYMEMNTTLVILENSKEMNDKFRVIWDNNWDNNGLYDFLYFPGCQAKDRDRGSV